LLLKQEGAPMSSVELSTRESAGWAIVALRGELDVTEAASVAAALIKVAGRAREIIIDLAGLEFMDSSGLAALVLARRHARQCGGDLLLVAPRQQVLRLLTITRLIDFFFVHPCMEEAVGNAERQDLAAWAPARPALLAPS
jgi:anti-sigma B factor antagonist